MGLFALNPPQWNYSGDAIAACTMSGSTTLSTTTTAYDGSYSGKAAGLDNCAGAVAKFTARRANRWRRVK
jgi:hypothetical protein